MHDPPGMHVDVVAEEGQHKKGPRHRGRNCPAAPGRTILDDAEQAGEVREHVDRKMILVAAWQRA
jgi:hypothetical protein